MARAWMIAIFCAMVHLELVHAQQNSTCNATTEQPVVMEVNPPSGTTGSETAPEGGRISTYIIRGQRLDSVSRAEITILVGQGIVHDVTLQNLNSTAASFRIPQTTGLPNGGSLATLALFPANAACQNISINMTVFDTGKHTINCMYV